MDRRRTADESEADDLTTTCRCGGVALETLGRQIFSTIRHCSRCQEAGRALERLPEAPQVLERDGGTAFVLVRKDRVRCVRGGDLVREHRLKQESPTRRLVADRCNSAMFLDFNRGHWISLFGRRLPDGPPPPEMRVMTADRRAEKGLPGDTPNYARHSGRFMLEAPRRLGRNGLPHPQAHQRRRTGPGRSHSGVPLSREPYMSYDLRIDTLKVDGAELYYERLGEGPPLLLIPGGPQDAGVFAPIRRHLAAHYAVITYDPRGNSRSGGRHAEDQQLDVHGDDAARLLEAVTRAPALVFGTSGGAQIGLNLAARHPGRVETLVAHEPPAIMTLEDPSVALSANQEVRDTYLREGVSAAMARFFALNGLSNPRGQADRRPPEGPSPELAETFARMSGNFEHWLAHGLLPLSLYRPDVERLTSGLTRLVLALGEESVGRTIHDVGLALAAKLGVRPVEFPGDHTGYVSHPEAFARVLRRALARS